MLEIVLGNFEGEEGMNKGSVETFFFLGQGTVSLCVTADPPTIVFE